MAELEIKPTPPMLLKVFAVLLSAGLLVGILVWLLTGGGAVLFARKIDLKTYMPDATGLGVGAPVRLDGIQVGKVRNIQISGYLDMQRSVRVSMWVEDAYVKKIPLDSQTSLGSDTLIGDKFLDIAAGKSKYVVKAGAELPSEPADSAADKADLMYAVQDTLTKVNDMLIEVSSPDTKIAHYLLGDKEYNQVVKSIDLFEQNMRSLVAQNTLAGT